MAKRKKNKKVILITIILCLICGVGSYFGTLAYDKLKNNGEVKVKVTFEDNDSYVIPVVKMQTKEEALKEWPYIIHVENTGDAKGKYQIILHDVDGSNIKRDNLSYSLKIDKKEVASDKLSALKKDVLYQGEIDRKAKHDYELYIWVSEEQKDKEPKYEYKLEFVTIKAFGPGF